MDWKKEIAVLVYVKQVLAQLDTKRLWPHHYPAVAATPDQIAQAEARLGFALDSKYVDFLRYANGWRGFFQTVDLFGTDELVGASMQLAQERISYLEPIALEKSRVSTSQLFPIAVTREDLDLFVMGKPGTEIAGAVIWFAAYEIQRFPNFDEFFLAMVDYNRREIERSRRDAGSPPPAS